ncbi:MAG: hypothetical protein QXL57_08475, partial [Candidatus Bathyarchaeia archaeon]
AISLLLIAAVSLAYAVHTYWMRTATITGIKVIGIEAEILKANDYNAYRNKEPASLIQNGTFVGVITIFAENFEQIWLGINWTSNAEGLILNMTGQYVSYQWVNTGMQWQGVILPIGEAFPLSSYQVVDKTKMMYADPGVEPNGPIGYGLLVQITPWTEYVTVPGDYSVDVTFTMGFVGA